VEGKVTVVSPATDPNSTTVQVWVQAENPGEKLKPGASVHAHHHRGSRPPPWFPSPPFFPAKKKARPCLVIVSADSTAHRRQVELGVREGDKVQILNGVRPAKKW
jgi:HlyD family secretion protein